MTTATLKRVHLGDLHSDHRLWLNSLNFYKEEIRLLENRMEHIARRNNGQDVMAELEHFQNRYIREREVIDELRHDIKQHENSLERDVEQHPVAIDHVLYTDHTGLRDRMTTFEKLYRELKEEFLRWLVERM